MQDPTKILSSAGYKLSSQEEFEAVMEAASGSRQDRQTIQESQQLGIGVIKRTLRSAGLTYRVVTWMNIVMFLVGVSLFIAAAINGIASPGKGESLILGGLGVATFVSLFITRPIDKSQTALTNLVQVDIAFMNFNDQIGMWEQYSMQLMGRGRGDVNSLREASSELQRRTTETLELLQRYVEAPFSTGHRKPESDNRGSSRKSPEDTTVSPEA
jgi:hypothetical protein